MVCERDLWNEWFWHLINCSNVIIENKDVNLKWMHLCSQSMKLIIILMYRRLSLKIPIYKVSISILFFFSSHFMHHEPWTFTQPTSQFSCTTKHYIFQQNKLHSSLSWVEFQIVMIFWLYRSHKRKMQNRSSIQFIALLRDAKCRQTFRRNLIL